MNEKLSRKCSECGAMMVVKKGSKGKFWACTRFKDGCSSTAEFYGYSPKAGLDLELRKIDNGYVVNVNFKYSDDDLNSEFYCPDLDNLKTELPKLMSSKLTNLINQLDSTRDSFDDERPPVKTSIQPKSSDLKSLLAKVNNNRAKAIKIKEELEIEAKPEEIVDDNPPF